MTSPSRTEAMKAAEAIADGVAPEFVAEPIEPAFCTFLLLPCAFSVIGILIDRLDLIYHPIFWLTDGAIAATIFLPLEIRRRRHRRVRDREFARLLKG